MERNSGQMNMQRSFRISTTTRRSSTPRFECAREMCGRFVAKLGGDGFHEGVWLTELDGGLGELEPGEAGEGRFCVVTLKQPGEVGGGDVASFGGLLNAAENRVIPQKMSTAAEVGGVGGVDLGGGRLARVCAEHESVLQGGGCGPQAEATTAQRVVDDLLQQGNHAGGICHSQDAAGREIKIAHQPKCALAGEIEEVFYHGLVRTAADDLRRGGVKDEGMASLQLVRLICQCDAAAPFGDELKGHERKAPAVHHEVGGAPLAAAADEAEIHFVMQALLPIRQEKAACADDLSRKVVGLVGGWRGWHGAFKGVKPGNLARKSQESSCQWQTFNAVRGCLGGRSRVPSGHVPTP